VRVKFTTSGLGRSKWYEYFIRFVFGGTVTVLAGIVAKRFGPEVGGLFLAFPAIFPAAATLIEKHEKQKEDRAGKNGENRARTAAGVDAAGAAMGSIGLMAFAAIVWKGLPNSRLGVVLAGATLAWLVTSVSVWEFREMVCRRVRASHVRAQHLRADRCSASQRLNPPAHHGPSTTRRFDE
jgi:Protein of unknown function (DUF3147)